MIPKIYFYTTSEEGPPEGAYFQDLIVNLATGFKQLGIKYYASNDYWRISPESDRSLIEATPEVTHHDCDIVVLERQWYEENGCLPEGLFAPSRQYKTVYLDCNDGTRTPAWLPEFQHFDFIFKTHYSNHTKYPDNFSPWAFGLSERVLRELEEQIPWAEKQSRILVNFRNQKYSHSLRGYIQKTFVPQIEKLMTINTASDDQTCLSSRTLSLSTLGANWQETLSQLLSAIKRIPSLCLFWRIFLRSLVYRQSRSRFLLSLPHN